MGKLMAKEIELKFLIAGFPSGILKEKGEKIRQGYLSFNPEVRIRQKGEKFFVTSKFGKGFIREEKEAKISEQVFKILWLATIRKRVFKTRHELTVDGFIWEIDVYEKRLEGLIVAELELSSKDVKVDIPDNIKKVLIKDVTCDERYKNKNLAINGLPKGK